MIKLFSPSLAVLVILTIFLIRSEREIDANVLSRPNHLVAGEKLLYEASWADFLTAGEMSLTTKNRGLFEGVEGYHVVLEAQSVGLVRRLVYEFREVYEAYIDASTLRPFRAKKDLQHGSEHEYDSVRLDHRRKVAHLSDGRSLQIPPDTYDLASILYAVRGMDLRPGTVKNLTLLYDDQLYTLRVEVEDQEKVRTRMLQYETVRVAIKLVQQDEVTDPYKLRLYLTPDSRRLPVLILAEPMWGQVRVQLKEPAAL